jgi:hypothetical protein
MLVKGHSVPEVSDAVRGTLGERQFPRNEADTSYTIPKAEEVDIDVCAEGAFEFGTHFPTFGRVVLEEPVVEISTPYYISDWWCSSYLYAKLSCALLPGGSNPTL